MTNNRARRAILWYVTQFCLSKRFGEKQTYGSSTAFNPSGYGLGGAQIGDLVVPTSTPISEWFLSWLVGVDETRGIFVLESIETGKLCNWSNIGLDYLDRDEVKSHPEWRWSDKQFEFNDRWNRVCFKKHDAYITLPLEVSFGSDYSFALGTRTRFGFDDFRPSETFPDWRKFTMKNMSDFYLKCLAEHEAFSKRERAAKAASQ
jgi:hypothetical protein